MFDTAFFLIPPPDVKSDYIMGITFVIAIVSLFLVGFYAIFEISNSMKKEFEDIKKKQRDVKEYKVAESVHTGGYS